MSNPNDDEMGSEDDSSSEPHFIPPTLLIPSHFWKTSALITHYELSRVYGISPQKHPQWYTKPTQDPMEMFFLAGFRDQFLRQTTAQISAKGPLWPFQYEHEMKSSSIIATITTCKFGLLHGYLPECFDQNHDAVLGEALRKMTAFFDVVTGVLRYETGGQEREVDRLTAEYIRYRESRIVHSVVASRMVATRSIAEIAEDVRGWYKDKIAEELNITTPETSRSVTLGLID